MKFKNTFRVSAGSAAATRNGFISIDKQAYGEAARSVYYGPSDEELEGHLSSAVATLSSKKEITLEVLENIGSCDMAATVKSAAVAAGLNYLSAEMGIYPWDVLGIEAPPEIVSSFTIGIDDPGKMLTAIRYSDCPLLKLKLGFEGELDIIKALGDFPDKLFRVDANGAWSPEKAEEMMFYLNTDYIEIVEQPTSLDYIKEWKYLKGKGKFKVVIDEGLNILSDYFKYSDFIDGINIKMAKTGGILEGIRLARMAKRDKLKVMLGCMVESSIGIAPALYMSSLADYFDLDGPLLLERDISDDINYNKNIITVDEKIIGGPGIKKEVLS